MPVIICTSILGQPEHFVCESDDDELLTLGFDVYGSGTTEKPKTLRRSTFFRTNNDGTYTFFRTKNNGTYNWSGTNNSTNKKTTFKNGNGVINMDSETDGRTNRGPTKIKKIKARAHETKTGEEKKPSNKLRKAKVRTVQCFNFFHFICSFFYFHENF
jgi:hypothetical protein